MEDYFEIRLVAGNNLIFIGFNQDIYYMTYYLIFDRINHMNVDGLLNHT